MAETTLYKYKLVVVDKAEFDSFICGVDFKVINKGRIVNFYNLKGDLIAKTDTWEDEYKILKPEIE